MADKAGATTPTKGVSMMEAVRQALAHFGTDAKPLEMRPWIKQQFGIDLSTDRISNYKSDIRKKTAKAKAPASKSSAQTPKPASPTPRKPAASKATVPGSQ